jgi:hypothetical protein
MSENTSTIDIGSDSNVNVSTPIVKNNYDDNDDKEDDIGPDHLPGQKTGED